MAGVIGKENEYWISFDIENNQKSLSGVRIKICRALEKDMHAKFNIALCDDPLYTALCKYVKSNPPKDEM